MIHATNRTLVAMAVALFALAGQAWAGDYANPQLLTEASELRTSLAAQPSAGADRPILVIDVREPAAYEAGHVPGAVNIAPDAVAAPHAPVAGALRPLDELAEMLSGLGVTTERRVVFYDDKGGFHAARMFWLSEYLGHRNVSVLDGGLPAWTATGGTLDTGTTAAKVAGSFSPAVTPRRIATADWILDRREDKDVLVIDVRPGEAFEAGHIPGP